MIDLKPKTNSPKNIRSCLWIEMIVCVRSSIKNPTISITIRTIQLIENVIY